MSIGLNKSMRAWHRWLGLFTSIQLLLWTVSGLFFTVPDITDVRGEQYRLSKDNLEIESSPKNLAPIQSIIKNDSDFMDEDFKIILKSPSFYAILITVLFLYFEIPFPQFVMNTVMLLAYGMIVMILMSLGVALTQMKVFSFRDALITSFGRVIIGPIIGFAVIEVFNISGVAAGVLLIQSSMPSAILCYLVASMYSPKEIVDNISSTIVVSTIMSLITIPITLFFALKYFY